MIDQLVEQRIAEAISRGDFDNLPGAGHPLNLDDDTLVPEELRLAYRVLKNAGYVPPEIETLREIGDLERCIDALAEGEGRSQALRKLHALRLRLALSGRRGAFSGGSLYLDKILNRFAESD